MAGTDRPPVLTAIYQNTGADNGAGDARAAAPSLAAGAGAIERLLNRARGQQLGQ